MKKSNALFILILTLQGLVLAQSAKINPLSKITITSNSATCQKDRAMQQQYVFNYRENVNVTFADSSSISANSLEIIFEGKDFAVHSINPKGKTNSLSKFKKVVFSGKVAFTSQNRTASADRAELRLAERLCVLTGNVAINQKKSAPKDVPIIIESDEATFNLDTEELTLTGVLNKPVNTVILLEDYEPLKKVKKSKRKHKK